jgi:hypothetical protein
MKLLLTPLSVLLPLTVHIDHLGNLSANEFDPNSIASQFGDGNPDESNSVTNPRLRSHGQSGLKGGDKRGRESFLMILSVAHGTATWTPSQIVWPFGGPTHLRQRDGPVAH